MLRMVRRSTYLAWQVVIYRCHGRLPVEIPPDRISSSQLFEMRERRRKEVNLRARGSIEHVLRARPAGIVELAAVPIGLVRIAGS